MSTQLALLKSGEEVISDIKEIRQEPFTLFKDNLFEHDDQELFFLI